MVLSSADSREIYDCTCTLQPVGKNYIHRRLWGFWYVKPCTLVK